MSRQIKKNLYNNDERGLYMKQLADLFFIFFRIGALTFGGGYAMLPILQKEIYEKRKWAELEDIMDYYAIAQCTPGIIAVNTSIFIGYKVKGLLGGIIAALGIVCPSILIILIIAMFLGNIMAIDIVQKAFVGIRIGVCALVLNATFTMMKKGIIDHITAVIFLASLVVILLFNVSPVLVVVSAASFGILLEVFYKKRKTS